MARWSPTVLPQPVDPLASILSAGYEGFKQARDERRQRLIEEATLAGRGIYLPGTALPEEPNAAPVAPTAPETRGPTELYPSIPADTRTPLEQDLGELPTSRPSQPPPPAAAWTPDRGFGTPIEWGFGQRVAPQRFITTRGGARVENPDYTRYQAEETDLRKLGIQEQLRLNEQARKNHDAYLTYRSVVGDKAGPFRPGLDYGALSNDALVSQRQQQAARSADVRALMDFYGAYRESPEPETKRTIARLEQQYGGPDLPGLTETTDVGRWGSQVSAARAREARQSVAAAKDEATNQTAQGYVDVVSTLQPDHPALKRVVDQQGNMRPLNQRDRTYFQWLANHLDAASKKGLGHAPLSAMGISGFTRFTSATNTMAAQDDIMRPIEEQARRNPKLFGAMAAAWTQLARYGSQEVHSENDLSSIVKNVVGRLGLSRYEEGVVLRYTLARARWAFEDGTIQLRGGTDFRVRLDDLVSGMPSFPTPDTINDAQEGRRTRLRGYAGAYNPAFEALGRAKTKTDMQDYIRILRAGGYTPDDIKQTLIQHGWVTVTPGGKP